MHKVWKIQESDIKTSKKLAIELKLPLIIAQLLVNRGIVDAESAYDFLYPDLNKLHSPVLMKGIPQAVDRIRKAINDKESIWIYGDYDVDGITSVSLLTICLKRLGAKVDYYIPHRIDEGYGLNKDGLLELKNKGCNLIITTDCGISSYDEVNYANDLGMDVIITDHHEPPDKLPPALVIIDPKLTDSGYPFYGLAGVGVAFKLACALVGDSDNNFLLSQLDLVAMGTIADVVPLIGENRIIAKYGLEAINRSERAGIKALCQISSIEQGKVDSFTVSYRLSPRINAAGRIDTAFNAVQLMTADSYQSAIELAQRLDKANKDRQNIEKYIMDSVHKQIQKLNVKNEKCLILAEEKWHQGVIGIVASKIQELYYRPTILISLDGDVGHGSARSIPEFDIFDALTKCSHLLSKFGGHKSAAGLSIPRENINKFRVEFSKIVESKLSENDLQPKVDIDAEVSLSEFSEKIIEQLSLFEPYGLGNPQPLFAVNGLSVKGFPGTDKSGKHLRMLVTDGKNTFGTIAFNKGTLEREFSEKNIKFSIACRPYINVWNDSKSIELKIEEFILGDSINEHKREIVSDGEFTNLSQIKIIDRRNIPDKRRYIQRLISQGEKSLLYVRDDLAVDQLNKIILSTTPKMKIGLCYCKTPDEEIDNIKYMLVQDELKLAISCIPFDEPLPGLKHLVFCHPTLTMDSFINSCAPAIEVEEPVNIHLIFNNNDIDIITKLLNQRYPNRKVLVMIYRKIKELYETNKSNFLDIREIETELNIEDSKGIILSNALSIFEELKILEKQDNSGRISLLNSLDRNKRYNLANSKTYSSGDRLKNEWAEFSDFILKKKAEEISNILIKGL
ncbi:MAG: single-stranded-DNA-specific exonuclease RecJ [bacterium]